MKRKVNIVISGHFGEGNIGDESLLESMISQIRNELSEQDLHFTVFSGNVKVSSIYHSETFIYSGRYGIFEPNKKGIYRICWVKYILHSIYTCDIFITGPGTILQDKTSKYFLLFWFIKVAIAKLFNKKVMFYGVGVGPLKRKFSKLLLNTIGKEVDLYTVRGHKSYEELIKYKIPTNKIKVTADPAITLEPNCKGKIYDQTFSFLSKNKKTIGINLREYNRKNQRLFVNNRWIENERLGHEYINVFSDFINKVNLDNKYNILLLPMCVNEPQNDRNILEILSRNINSESILIHENLKPNELKGLFSLCDYFIGMRLHSIVFSTSLSIPTISIAYADKVYDYMDNMKLNDYIIDIKELNTQILVNKFNKLVKEENRLREQIACQVINKKADANYNSYLLKELLYSDFHASLKLNR